MQYKTLTLALLEANPKLHAQLKSKRQLLPEMHRLSAQLKANHLELMEQLQARRPSSDPLQIRAEALELALENLRLALSPSDSDEAEAEEFLDGAMAFVKPRTPRE